MMLSMVDFHGRGIDGRRKRVKPKAQFRKLERVWSKRGGRRKTIGGPEGAQPIQGVSTKPAPAAPVTFKKRSLVHETKMNTNAFPRGVCTTRCGQKATEACVCTSFTGEF